MIGFVGQLVLCGGRLSDPVKALPTQAFQVSGGRFPVSLNFLEMHGHEQLYFRPATAASKETKSTTDDSGDVNWPMSR